MEAWKEELYHHGILGMRWGKKNGPPYPLGASDHSAAEKKAGWRKSLKGTAHRTLAKVYEINERTYSKSNKTLASMNRAAKEEQLKKAAAADKAASKARADRNKKIENAVRKTQSNKAISKANKYVATKVYKAVSESNNSGKSLNPLLNQMHGRKINATYEQRKKRGEALSMVGRTRVGALGRYVGRGILTGAGLSAVSGITHLAASDDIASVVDTILKGAAGAYTVSSVIRTYQDIADISTYKDSKYKK